MKLLWTAQLQAYKNYNIFYLHRLSPQINQMMNFIDFCRQELIDAFVESRYMMFIKYAAVQLQQLGLRKQMDMFSKDKPNLAIEEKEKLEVLNRT